MGERHLGAALRPHDEGLRREDEQGRRAAGLGHAGEARRLQAAVGVDAVDHGDPVAHFVHGDVEDAPLFVEGARRHFRGVGIDGDGADAGHGDDIAEVLAVGRLVDAEVVLEGQQAGRDHPLRPVVVEPGHGCPSPNSSKHDRNRHSTTYRGAEKC